GFPSGLNTTVSLAPHHPHLPLPKHFSAVVPQKQSRGADFLREQKFLLCRPAAHHGYVLFPPVAEKDAALRLFHSPLRRRHCEVFRFLLLGPHKHALRSQQSSGRRPSAKYPIFVRWLFGEINSKGRAAD